MVLFRAFCLELLATIPLLALSASALAAVSAGKAVSASGDVLIRNENGGPALRKLKSGDDILKGDVINTSSNGSAKLLMTDKSVLDLGPSTLFKVDEFDMKNGSDRKVALTMGYGKLRAAVNTPVGAKGRYNIRTKTATMGVRGTEFIVAADLIGEIAPPKPAQPGTPASARAEAPRSTVKTQVTVVEGKVAVADNTSRQKAPVTVIRGEQITTAAEVVGDKVVRAPAEAAAPKIVELSQEQMKSVVQEAKVEDKTFKQAVVIDPSAQGGPSSGVSTLAEVSSTLSATPDFAPNPGMVNTPGTFGPGMGLIQGGLPPGSPVNLEVVFKK